MKNIYTRSDRDTGYQYADVVVAVLTRFVLPMEFNQVVPKVYFFLEPTFPQWPIAPPPPPWPIKERYLPTYTVYLFATQRTATGTILLIDK